MKKSTWVRCYTNQSIDCNDNKVKCYKFQNGNLLIGEYSEITDLLKENGVNDFYLEVDYHNALFDYPHYLNPDIRIEKGAVIREGVTLKKGAIVLMNATVNKGAVIGQNTMVDMNAVVGSSAIIGDNVHVAAGSVIAGVLELQASSPVVIEDDCFIGAGSIILSGIRIGKGAIVGAGSIVTKDVKPNTLVYGNPAKEIGRVDEALKQKTALNWDLREADN